MNSIEQLYEPLSKLSPDQAGDNRSGEEDEGLITESPNLEEKDILPGRLILPLGRKISEDKGKFLEKIAPLPPDPHFRKQIIDTLIAKGIEAKFKPPILIRRQKAGEMVLEWMGNRGGFVQDEEGDPYYYYRPEKCLFDVQTDRFGAFLYAVAGANPSGPDYSYLMTDCKTAAMRAPRHRIVKVACWDNEERILRISRFDGTVFRLDGKTITEEVNGDGALFYDDQMWQPYAPDLKPSKVLQWLTTELPMFESAPEIYGLALRAWTVSMFFCELCPTRPLLVLIGPKGSGKSMTLRIIKKSVFGPSSDISGVPDKPDGFTAAAAAAHLLVLDNLDEFTPWLRDKLARISTGAIDEYRKLYSNNEVGHVRYRCWVAFTARTPDTLKRDDIADRLIILPTKRNEQEWKAEREFLDEVLSYRNLFWGGMLLFLNQVVASIREGNLGSSAVIRMADWESLGRVIAKCEGREKEWASFVSTLEASQRNFLIEDDLIAEGLYLWMQNPENHGKEILARDLYKELAEILFPGKTQLPRDWPKGTRGFGNRLTNLLPALQDYYKIRTISGGNRSRFYSFNPKEQS